MEASALTQAGGNGLLGRRSPLLRLQGDERLVALIRAGHDRAFEVLFYRYQSRLLSFCRHLLGSPQDAEDVLQEVFAAAHAAMLADQRPINVRPWLYRIARNRCLNHLRRPVADGQDSMDVHPHENGTSTLERVQDRERLREICSDVQELPETQRAALVLREIDDLSYTEIAQAMGTTLPAVKSLLVRARMSLAEASEARVLTCDEVRLELAEAAEGLCKLSGPGRRHVRDCARCRRYRGQLRSSTKALASLAPFGLLALFQKLLGVKLGGGSAAGGSAGSAGSAGGAAGTAGGTVGTAGGAAGTAGGAAAAAGGSGAAFGGAAVAAGSAAGGLGGVLGAKAAVGMATAALITAGAVEVKGVQTPEPASSVSGPTTVYQKAGAARASAADHRASHADQASSEPATATEPTTTAEPTEEPAPLPASEPATTEDDQATATSSSETSTDDSSVDGSATDDSSTGDIVVEDSPPSDSAPPPPDPLPDAYIGTPSP